METTVAIEFAASWKPFMKSKASATTTSITSVTVTVPASKGFQPFSSTTPSITRATSWHLSVVSSMSS